jgi:hypothetical protein
MSERGYAYATPNVGHAWDYAEKAWNIDTSGGAPRVYKVASTGDVERDPTEWPEGEHHDRAPTRGNWSTDVRSQSPFTVLSEESMPEHMGPPEDWA